MPAAPAAPAELSEGQVFDIVHAQLDAMLGDKGLWAVVPRGSGDTDSIFQSVLTRSFAVGLTAAIQDARGRLTAGSVSAPITTGVAVAEVTVAEAAPRELSAAEIELAEPPVGEVSVGEAVDVAAANVAADPEVLSDVDEPAAFRWEPAPITVWTDLKKPVTGPLAQVTAPALVA